jgi:hypothetical protein
VADQFVPVDLGEPVHDGLVEQGALAREGPEEEALKRRVRGNSNAHASLVGDGFDDLVGLLLGALCRGELCLGEAIDVGRSASQVDPEPSRFGQRDSPSDGLFLRRPPGALTVQGRLRSCGSDHFFQPRWTHAHTPC